MREIDRNCVEHGRFIFPNNQKKRFVSFGTYNTYLFSMLYWQRQRPQYHCIQFDILNTQRVQPDMNIIRNLIDCSETFHVTHIVSHCKLSWFVISTIYRHTHPYIHTPLLTRTRPQSKYFGLPNADTAKEKMKMKKRNRATEGGEGRWCGIEVTNKDGRRQSHSHNTKRPPNVWYVRLG